MRGREQEKTRAKFHRWLKETKQLGSIREPHGNLPQSAIDCFKTPAYGGIYKRERSDS